MHNLTLPADVSEKVSRGRPVIVRRTEPDDYGALHRIFSGPEAVRGTLQLPLPAKEMWRVALHERFGFEIEETHRRYAFRDGEYTNAYSIALVRG